MVRYKNRYIVGEIQAEDRLPHAPFVVDSRLIASAVRSLVQQMHGDFGVAAIQNGFLVKYCNPYTKIVLIRVRHGPHRFVASVLPLLKRLGNIQVRITTLYVGATLMQCFRAVKKHQVKVLEVLWEQMKTDADRLKLKEALLDMKTVANFYRHSDK